MKYPPKKVYLLEGGGYVEISYQEFCTRRELEPSYASKRFIPIQGMLLEVPENVYSEFYREKERGDDLAALDQENGLLSLQLKRRIHMKTFRKLFALCLVLALCLTALPAAFAATVPTATIDTSHPVSLSLYKYDFTTANADGVLELDSYVSTGTPNEAVEQSLSAYAIPGVVFSYVKVADIVTYSVQEADSYKNMVLYRMTDNTKTTQLLSALGLTKADAYRSESGALDFTSDTLNRALSAKLEENASAQKNTLGT